MKKSINKPRNTLKRNALYIRSEVICMLTSAEFGKIVSGVAPPPSDDPKCDPAIFVNSALFVDL
jgi:hypothetical protein